MAQQQKKQNRPKQPQDPYAQQGRQLMSAVQRLRGWVGSDPSRTPELADALVALTEHRLLGHAYTVAAPEAQESVKLAAQLLTANGPIGPYTSVADAARYVTAVVQLGVIQSAAGLAEPGAETVASLNELREELGSLPLAEALAPTTKVWALSCLARGALATEDVPWANACADAALQRLAEAGLRSQADAAYVVVDTDRLVSDTRWAAGSVDEALTHLHVARDAYDRLVDGRLAQAGRLAPALLQRLAEPLHGLYRDLADRLLAVGEVDLGMVTRRQLVDLLRGLAARDDTARVQLAASLADLMADLQSVGRSEDAELVAEELEQLPRTDRTAAAELAAGLARGDGDVTWEPLGAFAAYAGAQDPGAAAAAAAEAALQRETEARLAAEREEAHRIEQQRLEEARVAAEHREAERAEAERLAAERAEVERLQQERATAERVAAEQAEAERIAAEEEAERQERKRRREERMESHRLEQEQREAERAEAERLAMEQREAERRAADPAEIERLELERLQAELAELERIEQESEAEAAAERARAAAEEAARAAAEEAARVEAEEAARVEAERLAEEQRAEERAAAERAKAEEWEAQRLEEARLEAERAEAARIENERIENARIENERAEAERAEADRAAADRLEAERAEAERRAADDELTRIETERIETERIEAERLEHEHPEQEQPEHEQPEPEHPEQEQPEQPDEVEAAPQQDSQTVEPATQEAQHVESAPDSSQPVEPAPEISQPVESATVDVQPPAEDELGATQRAWQEAKVRGDRKVARALNEQLVELLRPRADQDLARFGPQLLYALEELSSARLRAGELFASRGPAREAKALAKALGRR